MAARPVWNWRRRTCNAIWIAAEPTPDARHLHLCVHDQGPGFAPTALPLLPGPRLAGQLSLAACRSIVQEHGGQLDAANDPNGGASVHIRLPLQAAIEPKSGSWMRPSVL